MTVRKLGTLPVRPFVVLFCIWLVVIGSLISWSSIAAARSHAPDVAGQIEGFKRPRGVHVDSQGNIYVADTENHVIRKFDPAGKYLLEWGGLGKELGKFRYPRDVAVGPNGRVFVADTLNDRIQIFTPSGTPITVIDSGRGSQPDQLDTPKALSVGAGGQLYVADTFNNRVQVFSARGIRLFSWGGSGDGHGGFRNPSGIAISPSGDVYVSDTFHDRIQVFNAAGGFVRKWGGTGRNPGQLLSPRGIDVDIFDRVYVSDSDNHRIQVFASDGTFVQAWGSEGEGADQFRSPKGLALGPFGRIFVADQLNNTVPVFAALSEIEIARDPVEVNEFSVGSAAVTDSRFDSNTLHNIPNLRIVGSSGLLAAGFLDYYLFTGGDERWGSALSEVFEESPGVLTQYFERGVVDWRVPLDLDIPVIERRLAWEFIGGADMGFEPNVSNPHNGIVSGPWGHKISNLAIDGTKTGFLDYYQRHGGEVSFGFPKTEARQDVDLPGRVRFPKWSPGAIRQYFQAAVLEFHPGESIPVVVTLIGYEVLARLFPDDAWREIQAFSPAQELQRNLAYYVPKGE